MANGKKKKKIAFIANYVHYFFLFFLSCLHVYRAAFCLAIDKWLVLIKKNIAASMPTMTIYYCRAILYSKHMNQVVFIWQMITIIIIIINRLWCTQRIESLVVAVVSYHAIRRNCLPFSTVREKKKEPEWTWNHFCHRYMYTTIQRTWICFWHLPLKFFERIPFRKNVE